MVHRLRRHRGRCTTSALKLAHHAGPPLGARTVARPAASLPRRTRGDRGEAAPRRLVRPERSPVAARVPRPRLPHQPPHHAGHGCSVARRLASLAPVAPAPARAGRAPPRTRPERPRLPAIAPAWYRVRADSICRRASASPASAEATPACAPAAWPLIPARWTTASTCPARTCALLHPQPGDVGACALLAE